MAKDGKELENSNILSRKVECDSFQYTEAFLNNGGRKGRQSAYITAVNNYINTFLFEIYIVHMFTVNDNIVGIFTTLDGMQIEGGSIAVKNIGVKNNFQDVDEFLELGGNKGLQPQVILAGSYYLNPWFVSVEQIIMTEIPIGSFGVVISYVGKEVKDLSEAEFKHGNIDIKGEKGV